LPAPGIAIIHRLMTGRATRTQIRTQGPSYNHARVKKITLVNSATSKSRAFEMPTKLKKYTECALTSAFMTIRSREAYHHRKTYYSLYRRWHRRRLHWGRLSHSQKPVGRGRYFRPHRSLMGKFPLAGFMGETKKEKGEGKMRGG